MVYKHEATNDNIWDKALKSLNNMDIYNFLTEQFQLLIMNKTGAITCCWASSGTPVAKMVKKHCPI